MMIRNRSMRWAGITLCLLLGVCAGAASTSTAPSLAPQGRRIVDPVMAADRATLNKYQERLANVDVSYLPLGQYERAKALAWLDFAQEEYDENDRTGIIEQAFGQAAQLCAQLEAKQTDISLDTPLVKASKKVRPDLWQLVADIKAQGEIGRVAVPLAQLEVTLVVAGHEVKELGWRHARESITEALQDVAQIHLMLTATSTPPGFLLNPPADLVIEQAAPEGTREVALGTPTPAGFDALTPHMTNDAPALFPPGTTTVTWTATDTAGHSATTLQRVIVVDTIAPALTPPTDVTVTLTDAVSAPVTLGAATLGTPTVSDAADPHPVVTNDAPALFPLGLTTITWTAKDATGNTARAVQRVTVVTATPQASASPPEETVVAPVLPANPVATPSALGLMAPHDIVAEVTGLGTAVSLGQATAAGFSDPAPAITNNAPQLFPLGVTLVTWSARDSAGHVLTAKQKVTIVDTTPPLLAPKPDITVRRTHPGALMINLGTPSASDNCGVPPTLSNNAPKSYPLGATLVIWTATDPSKNTTKATQKVTVVNGIPPRLIPPPDIITQQTSTAGTPVGLGTPMVSYDFDKHPRLSNDAPKLFPLGKTIVTWRVEDADGNVTTGIQVVTVLEINLPAWVHFAVNEATIKPNTERILARIAAVLRQYPDINVSLVGHTDPSGSAEYNMRLGQARAQALYNYFAHAGVIPDRLSLVSVGKTKPVATGQGAYVYAMNRTVELCYSSTRGQITTNRHVDDLQLMR